MQSNLWTGRIDQESNPGLAQRWHQQIKPFNEKTTTPGIALLGFACDEGVKRNHGRPGAKRGPDTIRKALANLPWHRADPAYDAGNIECSGEDLESFQQAYSDKIKDILDKGLVPVGLGGGHEIAWGSYRGLMEFLLNSHQDAGAAGTKPNVGIINFDAHFDLRLPENGASSGTPFWQMARFSDDHDIPFQYMCLGVSKSSNTQALFARAREFNVVYRTDEQINWLNLEPLINDINHFIQKTDHIYLTIDLDAFPASQAPGVSAPAARGIPLDVVEALLNTILASGKVRLFDLAEFTPTYDVDNHTARLAARLVHQLTLQDTTDGQ